MQGEGSRSWGQGRRGQETWRLQASSKREGSEEAGKALTSCPHEEDGLPLKAGC